MRKRLSIILFYSFMLCFVLNTFSQQSKIDSLLNTSKNSSLHDTVRINARCEFGEMTMLLRVGYWDSIAQDCNLLLKIKQEVDVTKNLQKSLAHSLNNIGYIYKIQGDIKQGLLYYHKGLEINKKIGDKIGEATGLNNIAQIYSSQGNLVKALEYLHKSLAIREKISDKRGIANTNNNLGIIYHGQWDTINALKYYQKSLEIRQEINDKKGIAQSLNNIGSIYEDKKELSKALIYYNKSLAICKEIEDKRGEALAYSNIAFVLKQQNDLERATEYYRKSLKIREEIGVSNDISNSLTSLGIIFFDVGNIKEALSFAERSLTISEQMGYPENIRNASELLSKIYEYKKEDHQALKMYKLFIQMRDSINSEQTQKITIQQQVKYEYEKQKVIDDAAYEKSIAISNEQEAKQRIISYSAGVVLVLVAIFLLFVFNRLQVTKKQKGVIEIAHYQLEEKNKEITDSIQYAKRIQNAILPPNKVVKEYLPESFIIYKPKDIVAGDFYWMEKSPSPTLPEGKGVSPPSGESEGAILFAACDCTGHGVPGAMVSVICNNGLNRAVREHGLTDPGKILDKTREIVIQEFEKSEDEVKDGMDIALCSLQLPSREACPTTGGGLGGVLKYAGANNPLWIIRNNELLETKADKQPIGKFDQLHSYTTHTIELQKGDTIYIFSDGYVDQFGGEKGKKFKAKSFKELLLSINDKTMEEQQVIINQTFEDWKGANEQVDDICVIGVKI